MVPLRINLEDKLGVFFKDFNKISEYPAGGIGKCLVLPKVASAQMP